MLSTTLSRVSPSISASTTSPSINFNGRSANASRISSRACWRRSSSVMTVTSWVIFASIVASLGWTYGLHEAATAAASRINGRLGGPGGCPAMGIPTAILAPKQPLVPDLSNSCPKDPALRTSGKLIRSSLPNRYNCTLAVRLFYRTCNQAEIFIRRASRPFVGLRNKSLRPSRISPAHPTV